MPWSTIGPQFFGDMRAPAGGIWDRAGGMAQGTWRFIVHVGSLFGVWPGALLAVSAVVYGPVGVSWSAKVSPGDCPWHVLSHTLGKVVPRGTGTLRSLAPRLMPIHTNTGISVAGMDDDANGARVGAGAGAGVGVSAGCSGFLLYAMSSAFLL